MFGEEKTSHPGIPTITLQEDIDIKDKQMREDISSLRQTELLIFMVPDYVDIRLVLRTSL